MPLKFLFLSANPPTRATGCGKRAVAAMQFLIQAGHQVTLWSPLAQADSRGPNENGWLTIIQSSELERQYDVVWAMDNWTANQINWAANVLAQAKQKLGAKITIEGTGDHLKQAKSHFSKTKPDIFNAIVAAERKLWTATDLLLAVSGSVAVDISGDPYKPPQMSLMTLPLEYDGEEKPQQFSVADKHQSICLPGSLHGRNHHAFVWFIRQVWPQLQRKQPDLILRIIGGGTEALADICGEAKNIDLVGKVSNFSAEVSRSLLAVVPADAPGGVKTVVFDALLAGTPVIGMASNNKRLGFSDPLSVISATTAEEYTSQILDFLSKCTANEAAISESITSSVAQYQALNDFNLAMDKILDVIVARLTQKAALPVLNTRDDYQLLFVGTYHKTGTVLMNRIFDEIARRANISLENIQKPEKSYIFDTPNSSRSIVFDYKCLFEHLEGYENIKGIRIVRDPRMLIISATRYHLTSSEKWLHQPRADLGGLTYQQYLCGLPSFEEQAMFEMAHSSKDVIFDMLAFNNKSIAPYFATIQLEDLMQDESLDVFFGLFRHLQLQGEEIIIALQAALKNSVFSQGFKRSDHMRGRAGEDWSQHYTPKLLEIYEQTFGDAHTKLGYD